jgi:branched-chain amino acid transport system substrate-binding protein
MNSSKQLVFGVLASVTAVALSGCSQGQGGAATTTAAGEVTIGISLPLTGDFAEPGKGVQRGYEAWAKYVNENGGLLGQQVKLTILDDQSNADRVASDYEKLINSNKVDLIFGPFSTRLVIPAAQVAKDYGYLFVEPAGAAKEVFTKGFGNLFYAAPAVADDHYNNLAKAILAMPIAQRPKTAAYASMDDPFAQGTAYGLKAKLEAGGVKTVVNEVYPPDTTDFGGIAAKIASSKADIVVGGTQYQDAVNLIVALRQLNYQPKLAAFSTAPTNPEFPKAIGSKTDGILSPTGYTPVATWPSNVKFVEYYTKLNGTAPGEDEANAWTTGEVVAAAVTAVKCADPSTACQTKLINYLHQNTVETVVGPLSWDKDGRPLGAHMIQQFAKDAINIVLPAEAKKADLVYPKPQW